ncbi:MAG: ParB/RepB/Spo0J family partition protein [Bacilli bacterium]|nr:ParB/RepB/Spo0J family partition protein [Bacilli bacterium]
MYPDTKDEVVQLYLDDIIPNRFQPREVFDEKALKELAVSIKEHGVIQPIIVRSVNGKYEIIAGERRYKASALAGLTKIPAIVRDLDDKESSKVALLENLQRRNLNPVEEARTYQKILEIDQMTQEELARTMGKSQSAVANKIRLLSLPDEIQEYLLKEELSERHARALLNIEDPEKQKEMAKKVIENKMSVRSLEDEIKVMLGKAPKEEKKEEEVPEVIASTSAFVNDNPLSITAKLEEEKSNYGKVTIAPPEGEENTMGKFINYGEIDKEEEKEPLPIPNETTSINVNEIKENTNDVKNVDSNNALDSLLNLGNPTSSVPSTEFITPAEKIVKTDSIDDVDDKSSDYFNTSDLSSIELPQNVINPVEEEISEKYTVEESVTKIKDLIDDLKNHGINVNADEMDFEKSYQIIIKIDKPENKE